MSSQTTDESLNDRAQQLLKLLVQHYIRDGQPVGAPGEQPGGAAGVVPADRAVRAVVDDGAHLGGPAGRWTAEDQELTEAFAAVAEEGVGHQTRAPSPATLRRVVS